jgi:CubicO group peptidase (beta-lactamase class C family)
VASDGTAPTGDTLFQIGSVTKVVTALLLADAVTRGEVELDTPLAAVLPGSPAGVTLAQLATHTSGLPRLPRGLRRQALRNRLDPYRAFGTDDVLTALVATRTSPASKRRYRYSNFGYGVLGQALERITGSSYGDLVDERVARPLGLVDTVATLRPDQLPRKATGHAGRRRPVPDWDLGGMPGAGVLWSTVDDLLLLAGAHLEPTSTPLERALRLVQEPRERVTSRLQLGLAWHVSPVGRTGRTALWHNGGTGGFRSFLALLPAQATAVTVLSNSTRSVDRVALRLLNDLAVSA